MEMVDGTRLRKEIKAWEHTFKAENLRDATVEDIRAHPKIAEKYKLYKKFTKESAASKASQKILDPPKTPPRRNLNPSDSPALISKPRPSRSSMASSSNNPFSPVKTPRKQIISPNDAPLGMPNFASASLSTESTSSSLQGPSRLGRALSKARKRLRGDSVSPSPKKQPRIFAPLPLGDPTEPDDDLAFIADSPVKATTGGKDFVSLFTEDRLPAPQFRPTAESGTSSHFTTLLVSPVQGARNRRLPKHTSGKLKKIISSNNIFGENPEAASTEMGGLNQADEDPEAPLRQRKRPSSCGSDQSSRESNFEQESTISLLPPSPIQNGQQKSTTSMVKGFAKKRKKLNALEVSASDDSLEDENIDVVEINLIQKTAIRQNSDEEEDRFLASTFEPVDKQMTYASQTEAEPAQEPEISLSGEIRDILHISHSQTSEMKERALAESLLRGERRHLWQDDVWGAGEFDRVGLAASDDEEDWEGEGTPWEVGEL